MNSTNGIERAELQLRAVDVQGGLQKMKETVRKVFRSNHRLTVHVVAEEAGISKSTCHEILTENLGMHRVAAEFVSEDQIQNRVDVSRELVDRANADDNL